MFTFLSLAVTRKLIDLEMVIHRLEVLTIITNIKMVAVFWLDN